MDDEISPDSGAQDKLESALDLNFVPTWARKPPDNPYAGKESGRTWESGRERSGSRRDQSHGGRRDRGDRRGGRSSSGSRPRGQAGWGGAGRPGARPGDRESRTGSSSRSGEPRHTRRQGPSREGGRGRPPGRDSRPRLNVKVTFLPDRERLALVVQDIRVSRRAFPLAEIASRFLSREDLYLVKLELPPPAEGRERKTFLQCLACKRVFRSRSNAEAHLLRDHLDTFFSIEETEVEPPTGAFTCVARCGLSGTLLGPPNYHSYNEKIQELWSSRFAHMSKGDYLAHIETLRDEALVEQWKDSVRKKTTYRLKDVPEGHDAESMTRAEAQDWMQSKLNPLLRESPRCIVPGPQSRRFDDNALRAEVSAAWQKESRFPLTLLLALRPAFRHMGLHLFKVNARETFVTAIPPVPVDIATAPDIVRDIILFLKDHPGIPRQHVLDQLRPGEDQASTLAAELLLHLGNLVAAGGVIEYFDGTLALPRSGAVRQAAAASPSASVRKPGAADEPAEQASASTETAPLLSSVAPPAKDSPAAEAADLPPDDRPAVPHTPTTADIPIPTPVATSNEAVAPAPALTEADTQDVTPPEAEKVEAGS